MKKYKRILAGLLAINLAVSTVPTDLVWAGTKGQTETYSTSEKDSEEKKSVEKESTEKDSEKKSSKETGAAETDSATENSENKKSNEENTENNTENKSESEKTQETENVDHTDNADNKGNTGDSTDDSLEENEDKTDETENKDTSSEEKVEEKVNEDEQGDEVAVQAENDSIPVGSLKLNGFKNYDQNSNSITVSSSGELILLSYCDPKELQDKEINIQLVGQADLTKFSLQENTKITDIYIYGTEAMKNCTFHGIGTEEYPFQGKITGQNIPFTIDTTFFGGLSSKAEISDKLSLVWIGKGTKPMIANLYRFDLAYKETNTYKLPVKVYCNKDGNEKTTITMGGLIGTVDAVDGVAGATLEIGKDVVDYTNALNVNVTNATGDTGLICNTLKSGTINLGDGYAFPSCDYTAEAKSNAGGLIGSMEENTTLQINTSLTSKGKIEITADDGDAGGLVGKMAQSAKITTGKNSSIQLGTPTITGKTSAGGVAGSAENVVFADDELQSEIEIKKPQLKGSAPGANVGGFIGKYTLDAGGLSENNKEQSLSKYIKIKIPTVQVAGEIEVGGGTAGGYFGLLELKNKADYTIGQTNADLKLVFEANYKDESGGRAQSYGSLIGQVTTTDKESSLKIQNISVKSTFAAYSQQYRGNQRPRWHGGLVGYVGNGTNTAYVEVQNVDINVVNPHAPDNGYFGGVTGYLANNSIIKARDITLTTTDSSDSKIWEGGGVIGQAESGSVLELSGITDLTQVNYDKGNRKAGQLVGKNENALIYAKGSGNDDGWTYKRSIFRKSNGKTYNDLLCYGQVIRLSKDNEKQSSKLSSDLISINEKHEVVLKKLNSSSGWSGEITLENEDDFALLSIAWNSRGYFSADKSITTGNWSDLKSKNIKLNKNIDLSGTGITGLSRDTNTDEDTFIGTFNGQNHTVKLAVGETFGTQNEKDIVKNSDGCGIVYATNTTSDNTTYHSSQGLFAKTSNATIQNLTIDGNISISNQFAPVLDNQNKILATGAIVAGGIAGITEGTTKISNVTSQESIYADGSAQNELAVGGLFGKKNQNTSLELNDNSVIKPKIDLKNIENRGEWVSAGGIMGKAENGQFKLQVTSAKVGSEESKEDKYSYINTDASKYAYVGGLIGLIVTNEDEYSKGGNEDTIEIDDLTMDGFKINADKANSEDSVSGGLFGSIWQNVSVNFSGQGTKDKSMLTVKNCVLKAPNANGVGGLAYRSSGIWEIPDYSIDMQSLTINSGKDVGLLVCRGEKGNLKLVNEENKSSSQKIGALYVKNTAHWETAYKLAKDNSISIIAKGAFDEFVAYTVEKADKISNSTSNDDSGDSNSNGVISLATATDLSGKSRVGVNESTEHCTTYQNRTKYGQKHQTNGCSRYYYDLDQWLKEATNDKDHNNNNYIDTPQELMLWNAYLYAGYNIRKYITNKSSEKEADVKDSCIRNQGRWYIQDGEKAESKLQFDLKKYSYYPVTISNSSINIKNVTITFYNKEIENVEKNNKSTQGKTNAHSQHYTMHCGVLFDHAAPSATITADTVTFSGNIGKINSSASGVLIANQASGYVNGSGKAMIVYVSVQNCVLNNLKVNNCGENYAPLLINNVKNYANISVKGISTSGYEEGTAVASSLIGTVGENIAKQIILAFERIVLPDKKASGQKGIFSHATLLESFMHDGTSSSATYNFNKNEDWEGEKYKHKVTYGKEITETIEYPELQKWYYDAIGEGNDDDLIHESEGKINFSSKDYLPYVCEEYKYEVGGYRHEIKVNQRMNNIVTGCGTYGHPYIITSGREMKVLSEYMSGIKPAKGWCVTITGTQSENHVGDTDSDVTYKYVDRYENNKNIEWVKVTKESGTSSDKWAEDKTNTLDNNMMRTYLLNAYYDLEGTKSDNEHTLNLKDFGGFGTETYPFRGVLTSKEKTKVNLQGSIPANGLIGYSYGCVVRNLTISYKECSEAILTYQSPANANAYYYPKSVFGGIVGCVLGGDNIIDNVTIEDLDNKLNLDDGEKNKKYLIPVGGYVGEICGGGVIFRNLNQEIDTGLSSIKVSNTSFFTVEDKYFYVNPYVGRVLDGFAFYEVTKDNNSKILTELNNTNKNYKINTLTNQDAGYQNVTSDGNTTALTLTTAKELLILSAVVNSGATSDGKSYAYSNTDNSSNQTVNNVNYTFAGNYGKVRNADYNQIGENNSEDFFLSKKDDQTVPGTENLPYLIRKYCNSNAGIFSLSGESSNVEITLSESDNYDMTPFGSGYQGIGARYVSNAVLVDEEGKRIEKTMVVLPEIKSFDGNNSIITLDMQVKEYSDDDFRTAGVGGVFNFLRVGRNGCNIQNLTIQGVSGKSSEKSSEISLKYYDSDGKLSSAANPIVDVGGFAGAVSRISKPNSADVLLSNVVVKNLEISAPRNAGGLIGSSVTKNNNADIKVEEKFLYSYTLKQNTNMNECVVEKKDEIGIKLQDTKYDNINITASNGAGGFVGYVKTSQESSFEVKGYYNENEKFVGNNSSITSTYDTDSNPEKDTDTGAGGVFGYVGTNVKINAEPKTNYENAVIQNVTVSAGRYAGGFIGKIDEKNYSINQAVFMKQTVQQNSNITAKDAKVSTIVKKNTGVSTDNRKEGAGGIVGYAKGRDANQIINCAMEGAQINDSNTATTELNQDHEGAGGIIGLVVEGDSLTIDSCRVKESNIYGAVAGGIAGITKVTTTFKNCSVTGSEKDKSNIKARCTASGILGYWFSGGNGTIENCHVQYLNIAGQHWGVGALIGDGDKAGGALYLFDTDVQDSSVTAKDGSWYHAGGIIGDLRCDLTANNLLFSNVKIEIGETKSGDKEKHYAGLLIGKEDQSGNKDHAIHIAGISIQNIPETEQDESKTEQNEEEKDKEKQELKLVGNGDEMIHTTNDYIAFADYSGTALDTEKQGNRDNLLDADAEKPYVVTSPIKFQNSEKTKAVISLYEDSNDETAKYLYGDGAYWGDTLDAVEAKTIWENRESVTKGHYGYKNISDNTNKNNISNFEFGTAISTYKTNQPDYTADDFPVLQISKGEVDKVTDYLNILTNGGFSEADNLNKASDIHVSVETNVYEYQNQKFVKADKTVIPAFSASNDAKTGKVTFSANADYDNGKNRFTLLKVTFQEKDANNPAKFHKYNVLVPVLVRRMMEVDFTATLTYGTDFKRSDYSDLENHILENFGSPITGYLTYTYNSKNDEYVDYGWESYINAGANVMTSMEKSIRFVTESMKFLPKGTQLTLIDAKDGKSYYYNATGEEEWKFGSIDIALSSFKDSSGIAYQEPSISELMKMQTSTDENEKKIFIKVDEKGKPVNSKSEQEKNYPSPTVKIKNTSGSYDYYRLADSSLDETGECAIKVSQDSLQENGKSKIVEDYYLVITVPKTDDDSVYLNGSIQTKVTNKVPNQLHYRKVAGADKEDNHKDTASTYQLSNGYQQELKETGNNGPAFKVVSGSTMKVDITDTIKFPNTQVYMDYDQLYLKFTGGLQKTIKDGETNSTSAVQFPKGSTGTVKFYVYTEENNEKIYYEYKDNSWSVISSEQQEKPAISYLWVSKDGNMELPLSKDGTAENVISLGSLRQKLYKASNQQEKSTFYVKAEMDVSLPETELDVIPVSSLGNNNMPENYVKFAYSSQLSTVSQSLSYSSNRASDPNTTTSYYRDEVEGAKLIYDADQIDQLGINLLDLRYLDAEQKNTFIDTTATYDLSFLNDIENTLKESDSIKFTLTLCPKNTDKNESQETYKAAFGKEAENYLQVSLKAGEQKIIPFKTIKNANGQDEGSWSWIIPKKDYFEDNKIKTSAIFDGSRFIQQILLKVNIENVEEKEQFYSNYKVVLKAVVVKSDQKEETRTEAEDNIIYTLAKIKPEFTD